MPFHSNLTDSDSSTSLTFYCGDLAVDEVIADADHEPNGYFWEGLIQFAAPTLAARIELDSEAGMFAAYADRATLEELQAFLEPYLTDNDLVAETIRRAEGSGFEFDD